MAAPAHPSGPKLVLVVGTPGVVRLLRDAGDAGGAEGAGEAGEVDGAQADEVTPAQVDAQRSQAAVVERAVRRWNEANAARLDAPVSCETVSDLWYLQHPALQRAPTVCIGGADNNMLARLWRQGGEADVAGVYAADFDVRIHRDPEWVDLRAVIEARSGAHLATGVATFCREDLPEMLRAVASQVGP